jgi:hypothetical protein
VVCCRCRCCWPRLQHTLPTRPAAQVYRCLQGFRVEALEGPGLPSGPGADRHQLGPLPDYTVLTASGSGADMDSR